MYSYISEGKRVFPICRERVWSEKRDTPVIVKFSVRLAWLSASADDNCDREADAVVDVGKQFLRRLARHCCHV